MSDPKEAKRAPEERNPSLAPPEEDLELNAEAEEGVVGGRAWSGPGDEGPTEGR
jgi:hypothetical protein